MREIYLFLSWQKRFLMSTQIKGIEEVFQKFEEIPTKVQNKILRTAMRQGANIMRDEARALVPSDTGNLKKAITSGQSRSKDRNVMVFKVKIKSRPYEKDGVKKNPIHYAIPLEMGHLVVGKGGSIRGSRASRKNQRENMKKSGVSFVAPRPFMRPAFDSKNEAAFEICVQTFRDKIGEL